MLSQVKWPSTCGSSFNRLRIQEICSHIKCPWISCVRARRFRRQPEPQGLTVCAAPHERVRCSDCVRSETSIPSQARAFYINVLDDAVDLTRAQPHSSNGE